MASRIQIYVSWTFVSCPWSDQSEFMATFTAFNLWIGQSFMF